MHISTAAEEKDLVIESLNDIIRRETIKYETQSRAISEQNKEIMALKEQLHPLIHRKGNIRDSVKEKIVRLL